MGLLSKFKKMMEPSPEVVAHREVQGKITQAFDDLCSGKFDVKSDFVSKEEGKENKTSTFVSFQSKDHPKLKLEIKKDRSITKDGHEGWDTAHVRLTTKDGQKIDLIPHSELNRVKGENSMSVHDKLVKHAVDHNHRILSASARLARPNQNWGDFLKGYTGYDFPQAKEAKDTPSVALKHQVDQGR